LNEFEILYFKVIFNYTFQKFLILKYLQVNKNKIIY